MPGHSTAFELGNSQQGVEFEGKFLIFAAGAPADELVGYGKGALGVDTTNGKLYINTGTFADATWTVVGNQS